MSILDGFFKTKKYRKTSEGYKLQSEWTSANTVEYENGLTLQESEVYLTQAEYDALGDEKKTNNIKYNITDAGLGENVSSKYITYDNTESGLAATTVKEAIDENSSSISELNSNLVDFMISKYASDQITIPAGSSALATLTIAEVDGYTPVFYIVRGVSNTNVFPTSCGGYINSGTREFQIYCRNIDNSKQQEANVSFAVMYIKSEFVTTFLQ